MITTNMLKYKDPNRIWFLSDPHFNHAKAIEYCSRPFKSVLEMNEYILAMINSRVQKNDILFVLGDFAFGTMDKIAEVRHAINCYHVNLVLGNHDHRFVNNPTFQKLFSRIYEQVQIKVGKQELFLNHYAMRTWSKSHRGVIQLHGHSHGNLIPWLNGVDCGVDSWGYGPVSLNQILIETNRPFRRTKFIVRRLLRRRPFFKAQPIEV